MLTLQELVRGGHRFDVDEVVACAMSVGWTGDEVMRVRDFAQRILDGRRFYLKSAYGPRPGACADWEEAARQ